MSTEVAVEPAGAAEVEAVLADAPFRRRFALAYEGPGDPGDALFWLAHPDRDAPSGASPGTAREGELRRAVYATPAGAALAPELQRLQDLRARRRRAAEEAFRIANAEAVDWDGGPAPVPPPAEPAVAPAPSSARRLRRPVLPLAGCAALAALLGAALGSWSAVPQPTAPLEPRFTATVSVATRGPAELRRPWSHADGVTVTFGPAILADTVRRLAGYPDGATLVYGARDRFGHVCLLAAAIYYQSACVPADRFRASGITLTWTLDTTPPWRPAETGVAVWRPDGRLLLGPALP